VETNIANVGREYGFGAPNISAGWIRNKYDENDLDDRRSFVWCGFAILSGVLLKADVGVFLQSI
jgi:hypothetical protein